MSDEDKFKGLPIDAIEAEMESILTKEHGMAGVRVFLDRNSGDIACNQTIPDPLMGRVFAIAAKRAIIRFVHEQESRQGE